MKHKTFLYLIFLFLLFLYSCANQLPPSGGEDDKTPPKIVSISPKPNTINFRDNKIIFKFDEYVDRRSFQEAFSISPKPKGEIEFDWSGKEVEVDFTKSLDKDRTYVIIIGKDLKDVLGGNAITAPVTFAFSTGDKMDKGKISGKVYADNYDRVKILVYLKTERQEEKLNPEKNPPDYVIQVSSDGNYELTNLPVGEYRLFAIIDEDRNNLFDKDADKISILPDDYKLTSDSLEITNIDFLLKDFDTDQNDRSFLNQLKPDSINFIYSNVSYKEKNVPPDYRFYFYFKNNNLSKADIVNNFSLTDSAINKSYNPVFNWINDSLLEVFTTEKLNLASGIKISINLTKTAKNYLYGLQFFTAGKNNFGKISGKIISPAIITSPVCIKLYNKDNKFISYSSRLIDTVVFRFDEVLEGNYVLISFIDENDDGKFDKGNYYPFKPSEKFVIYEKDLKVKGDWSVENIFLNY